jgi:hypothetical protein
MSQKLAYERVGASESARSRDKALAILVITLGIFALLNLCLVAWPFIAGRVDVLWWVRVTAVANAGLALLCVVTAPILRRRWRASVLVQVSVAIVAAVGAVVLDVAIILAAVRF